MKDFFIAVIALFVLFIVSCEKDRTIEEPFEYGSIDELYEYNSLKISISQGLAGTLTLKEGNCMPMIGGSGYCNTFPVERTIEIFECTTKDDVGGYFPLYDEVNSKFIAKTKTDVDGFFQLELSPGKYSVFIFEKDKYYANFYNGDGVINPIEIFADSILSQNLRIDYAVY